EAENYITERFGKQEKSRYDSFYRNFLTIPSYGDIHSKIIFRKQVNPDYKWCGIIYRFETGRIEQFYYDMDIFTPEIKRGFMELGDKFFDKKLNKEEWQKLIELVEYIKSKALSSKQLVGKLVSQRQAMLKESQAIQVWIEGINERQFMIDFESLFADKDTLQIAVKNPKKRITLLRQQKFFRGADDNKFWHILGIRRVDNRESNITGNIIKGFTETEEKELRKGIEENSDKVRAENESAVQLVEERCAVLLKDKGNIEYLLRERGVPGDEINRVTYALEHPREAFKWFNAIVEGENRYLLGHETALAVNIVKFLIEKEAELGIDNLIDEYIFHEALENTSMEGVDGKTKHHNIIDFTSLFFRQKSYAAPHETPLGGALRVFIQGVAAPEAEISRRQSETRRAEESEYLDPSTRSLHDLAQDDSLRGAPSPISMNGMTGVDLHGSPSMNEMLGSLGSIPVRGMTEGEGSLEARSVGSPRISVPEFKPWISDVPKPEFIPLPEIAIKETSDNKESRISATLEAFSSEPVTKTRDPIAVVGLPEKIKNDTSINLEKLRGDISRGLGENGHGVPNDPHKVDFFYINPNDLETTKRGITDLLHKYGKERECVLFVPEMKDIKLKSDREFLTDLEKEFSKHLTIVPDAYTDLDFSLKKKFVGIDERIAITRLIGYYKEAETYDESSRELAQEEALTALTVFLAKINSEEVPQAKDLKDLNQLLKNLLLKIKPVDYNDIIEWEETQKAIATSL
ncbi:MAG: hypothetical protein KJ864_07965, partial [Candidatus Omnitrophica bacterium]|nr:hypothetical protein [Candidatus Omnitrophota bacterium]